MFVNLFEALPDGNTRLTLKVDITGRGYMKLVAPFSKGYIRNRVKKDIFEELKRNEVDSSLTMRVLSGR